ncbi:IQ calmodulin-binding motif protein [Metarhizium robertsii]|uniref:IQ motif, EF-hand binding site n=2 Tax=Metarhizium robertsii TaxID=568076 RepID=E9F9M0_METRA|nr:IQ motif, EF-hand binding site [Metarhizium robertsii ARSEF 23]EFY95513.1 IQ motif, EF-hand binding site [Metarhizium robertsii ARSEF 23]EXU98757.1 IQ calmodulin-binding motif protein [Metarhizium robertsii]
MPTSDSAISFGASTSASVSTCPSVPKTKEYMDSLVLPSQAKLEHIAQVQEEKEVEARRRARDEWRRRSASGASDGIHHAASTGHHKHERDEAAKVIQKTFRGYRARRELQGYSLNASTRWVTAVREAQFRQGIKPHATAASPSAADGDVLALEDPIDYRPASARQKWKKASLVARRAGHDDSDSESDSDEGDLEGMTSEEKAAAKERRVKATAKRRQAARMLGLQYFLEMVDSKHRYGSNLRMYHEEWKKSDTKENFFYWLDYGEGRFIELDTCPRDRLEREQVRYLSREERQYYLVRVDAEGRLCWVKNGARIDTTEQFKDSIHGVVPLDDPTPAFAPTASQNLHSQDNDDDDNDNDSDSSDESKREADRAAKYADPGFDDSKGLKRVTHISASTIFNQLLRKSVKKNTWIFVADTSFRLYVGIKDSGAFQHSSFLQGSRISAAGLIKIKKGRLSSLSPLSGHYRPPASSFRAFVKNLKEEGVDMSHVSISKSYTILVGLETYLKTRKKGKELVGKLMHGKDKLVAPEEVQRQEEEKKDKSESAEKERRVLEREREEADKVKREMSKSDRVMEKIKSLPVHAK